MAKHCIWGDDLQASMRVKTRIVLCSQAPVYEGFCEDHIPHTLRRKRDFDASTPEQRQQYLDLLHEGKTIGEAYRAAGITFNAALEITNRAIGDYKYLKRRID